MISPPSIECNSNFRFMSICPPIFSVFTRTETFKYERNNQYEHILNRLVVVEIIRLKTNLKRIVAAPVFLYGGTYVRYI